jgi:toxin ParE1/3/4
MVVSWTREATADRQIIFDFIAKSDYRAAIAIDHLFSSAAARLELHPSIGRPGRVDGTRELVVHRHYVVFYDLTGETIRIIRILHTAQQWPSADP